MEKDVKHGCCSCEHYKLPTNKAPCKTCKRWSNWVDATAASPKEKQSKGAT